MSGRSRRLQEQQLRQRRVIAGVVVSGLVVLVALVVALTAGGSSDSSSDPSSDAAAGVVSMIEMAFIPDPIDVTSDEARLRIVNDGLVPHSFVVPELGKGTPDLDPDAEMTLDFREVTPGTYTVICDIPGHREAGMETELIIR
jgi:plastocyanin